MTAAEQRVKDWNEFAAEVAEHLKANTTDTKAKYQETFSLETITGGIRLLAEHIGNPQTSEQECLSIAGLAQLAYTKLKDRTFNAKQAVEFLEQCKAVRPAHEPRLVVLSQCFGKALSCFIDRNYSLLDDMPSLPFKNHFIVVYPSGEASLTRDLPAYAEWVIASEDEIRQAVGKASGKDE